MRARDFIFEAVSRRGFLRGLGAAAAAASVGKKIPTQLLKTPSAATTAAEPASYETLFQAANSLGKRKDYDKWWREDLMGWGEDVPDEDPAETSDGRLTSWDEDVSYFKTPKGRRYVDAGGFGGQTFILSYEDNGQIKVVEICQEDHELRYADDPAVERIFNEIINDIWKDEYNKSGTITDNIGDLVDAFIDKSTDAIRQKFSQKQSTQKSVPNKQNANLAGKIIFNYIKNKLADKVLNSETIKQIFDQINAQQSTSSNQYHSNIIDVTPSDITVHEPMQALPAPQQALPPPTLADIEANFVQALGRDLTDQERVLIQQEYDKQVK